MCYRPLSILLAGAVLSGCFPALPPALPPDPPVTLDQLLAPLRGQNIQAAIAKLGYPASQQVIAGDTVYEWTYTRVDQVPVRTHSDTEGDFSVVTTHTVLVPATAHCEIQLGASADGTVKAVHTDGNEPGCDHYIGLLGQR